MRKEDFDRFTAGFQNFRKKKKNEKGGYWMINVETSHADVVVEEKNIVRTKQQM